MKIVGLRIKEEQEKNKNKRKDERAEENVSSRVDMSPPGPSVALHCQGHCKGGGGGGGGGAKGTKAP